MKGMYQFGQTVITCVVNLSQNSWTWVKNEKKPNNKRKEEGVGRMNLDSEDRAKIRFSLNQCIHPLKIESDASNVLVNKYNGEKSNSSTIMSTKRHLN